MICFACGGDFAPGEGAAHAYMASTPGCWESYGLVLAREYEDPRLFAACHRLTVDAYAVQHPGDGTDIRATHSFWVHLAALDLVLNRGRDEAAARSAMARLSAVVPPSLPPHRIAKQTHADVLTAPRAAHADAVRSWASLTLLANADALPILHAWIEESERVAPGKR